MIIIRFTKPFSSSCNPPPGDKGFSEADEIDYTVRMV